MNLTQEQLRRLPAENRDRYMDLERLFKSKGWKYVVATAQENVKGLIASAANATSWAQHQQLYGARGVWEMLANLEQITEASFERAIEENTRGLSSERATRFAQDEEDFE